MKKRFNEYRLHRRYSTILLGTFFLLFSINIYAKEINMSTIYDFKLTTINGEDTTLEPYKGKVLLIVNVASKCGYTPQYDGLETLYTKYKDKGLVVLGFPCNQFGSQEPGSEAEIQNFCRVNFGVTFPMFSKINVNGEKTHPLYQYLKSEQPGILGTEAIKWNFTKFLVDKEGNVVERFGSSAKPSELEGKIEALLK
jgi:glutathione peroxidase